MSTVKTRKATTAPPEPVFMLRIEQVLPKDYLADILITAVESGVGYWLTCERVNHFGTEVYVLEDFRDLETGQPFSADNFVKGWKDPQGPVSIELIARGIQRLFEPGVLPQRKDLRSNVLTLDAGMIDASDADVLFQLGLFGDVVFG